MQAVSPLGWCAPSPLVGEGWGGGARIKGGAAGEAPSRRAPRADLPHKGGGTVARSVRQQARTDISASIRLHARLHRVLDVLDLVELDIDQVAADLLDAADVDGLHDVARLRIDRDRAARA